MNASVPRLSAWLLGLLTLAFSARAGGGGLDAGSLQPKPAVDYDLTFRWPTIVSAKISRDGAYVNYSLSELPERGDTSSCILKSTNGAWERRFDGAGTVLFTEDSKAAVYLRKDSELIVARLGAAEEYSVHGVESFRVLACEASRSWFGYFLKKGHLLVLRNTDGDREWQLPGVEDISCIDSGRRLIAWGTSADGSQATVKSLELVQRTETKIWEGEGKIVALSCSRGGRFAFSVRNSQNEIHVWVADSIAGEPTDLTQKIKAAIGSGRSIESLGVISPSGMRLAVRVAERLPEAQLPTSVDVFHYRDTQLQSFQLNELAKSKGVRKLEYVVNLSGEGLVVQLQPNLERLGVVPPFTGPEKYDLDYLVLDATQSDPGESYWNPAARPALTVISLVDGSVRRLEGWSNPRYSEHGKYIVGYCGEDLWTYDLSASVATNVTKDIGVTAADREVFWMPNSPGRPWAARFWSTDDSKLYVFDRFDLWETDPRGRLAPRCVTNGFGRTNNIIFGPLEGEGDESEAFNSSGILTAFNATTKEAGFFRVSIKKQTDPVCLSSGPYTFGAKTDPTGGGLPLCRATDTNEWLVPRASAAESVNVFVTTDFIHFKPISSNYPEQKFNWVRAELHNFSTLDRRHIQGVLYKPENFDSKKKYPVIFHYYDVISDCMNQYVGAPQQDESGLPISWFVSRGYLVFAVDIQSSAGNPGGDAFNSVVGAAKYLSRFEWVDTKRLGLMGHSMGGYSTNYLVTHSSLFAAALTSAGVVDLAWLYGEDRGGNTRIKQVENIQYRMNATLWDVPGAFTENSPLYHADRITTPMLIVANQADRSVPFSHGFALFNALRRLGKRAWLLQYDRAGHFAPQGPDYRDYLTRITQYFDYYLGSAPPPKWMTEGVPARLKGMQSGLELDTSGRIP